MSWLPLAFGALAVTVAGLGGWRIADLLVERRQWRKLVQRAGSAGPRFEPATLAGLPEPAQRYLRYSIAPGTPRASIAEIAMAGRLGLGTKQNPRYRPMTARQILAPPHGLVWRVRAGAISGSDAVTPDTSWTRFWSLQLIPVVRVAGSADHHRSAFGRVIAEGAFWLPSSLLPGEGVAWEPVDGSTARATVTYGSHSQAVDITVEADGRPSRVVIQRWSNENADRVFREQPFGGYLSGFRDVAGYRIPTRVEGGNLIGSDDYFPFYQAEVQTIRFPQMADPGAAGRRRGQVIS